MDKRKWRTATFARNCHFGAEVDSQIAQSRQRGNKKQNNNVLLIFSQKELL
jgi:hypothetical protein